MGIIREACRVISIAHGTSSLFQQIDQRRKRLAQNLLFDQASIQKSCRLFKLKREVFDENRDTFLNLHQALQEAILNTCGKDIKESNGILARFQKWLKRLLPLEMLNSTQQKLNDL